MLALALTLPAGMAADAVVASLRGRGRLALAAGLVVVATASTAAVAVAQSRHDVSRPDTAHGSTARPTSRSGRPTPLPTWTSAIRRS